MKPFIVQFKSNNPVVFNTKSVNELKKAVANRIPYYEDRQGKMYNLYPNPRIFNDIDDFSEYIAKQNKFKICRHGKYIHPSVECLTPCQAKPVLEYFRWGQTLLEQWESFQPKAVNFKPRFEDIHREIDKIIKDKSIDLNVWDVDGQIWDELQAKFGWTKDYNLNGFDGFNTGNSMAVIRKYLKSLKKSSFPPIKKS